MNKEDSLPFPPSFCCWKHYGGDGDDSSYWEKRYPVAITRLAANHRKELEYMYVHTYIHTYIQKTNSDIFICLSYIYTHSFIHTYIHSFIHTPALHLENLANH